MLQIRLDFSGGNKVTFEKLFVKLLVLSMPLQQRTRETLQISLMLSGKAGDEVIVPAISFIATLNCVIYTCKSNIYGY